MNQNKYLLQFINDLKWFKNKKRTLEDGKKYSLNGKGFRNIHIRNFHDFDKHSFFRVRGLSNSEDETKQDTHSYPPKKNNRLGRCNLKSKPVFYAALDPVTAIYEYLNTGNENEVIHISQWKLKNKTSIGTFNIMQNPKHDVYTDDETGQIINYSNDLLDEVFELMISLYNESNTYEFSAPFSHFLLHKTEICQMIQYPSVTTNISKCVAIQTDFFDSNFYLHKVFKITVHSKIQKSKELEGVLTKGITVSGLEVGNVINNLIEYGEPKEEDYDFWNYYRLTGNESDGYKFVESIKS